MIAAAAIRTLQLILIFALAVPTFYVVNLIPGVPDWVVLLAALQYLAGSLAVTHGGTLAMRALRVSKGKVLA